MEFENKAKTVLSAQDARLEGGKTSPVGVGGGWCF